MTHLEMCQSKSQAIILLPVTPQQLGMTLRVQPMIIHVQDIVSTIASTVGKEGGQNSTLTPPTSIPAVSTVPEPPSGPPQLPLNVTNDPGAQQTKRTTPRTHILLSVPDRPKALYAFTVMVKRQPPEEINIPNTPDQALRSPQSA